MAYVYRHIRLDKNERKSIEETIAKFPLSITPYYLSLFIYCYYYSFKYNLVPENPDTQMIFSAVTFSLIPVLDVL